MGLLKGIVWSALCIGLGIFLGTHSFDGKTAIEHVEKLGAKAKVEEALDSAKAKLGGKEVAAPTEKHTPEDKDAVNKLIARRKP